MAVGFNTNLPIPSIVSNKTANQANPSGTRSFITSESGKNVNNYISSASAALALISKNGIAISSNQQNIVAGPSGLTTSSSGLNLLEIAQNNASQVNAQAFTNSINFKNVAGHLQATGSYQSVFSSTLTNPPSGNSTQTSSLNNYSEGAEITATIKPGSGQYGVGSNIEIKVNNDPKSEVESFINDIGGAGALSEDGKQSITDAIAQGFESYGLSNADAVEQAQKVSDFIFAATDRISASNDQYGNPLPATSTTASPATPTSSLQTAAPATPAQASSGADSGTTTPQPAAIPATASAATPGIGSTNVTA